MTGTTRARSPRRAPPRTTTPPLTIFGRRWCGISQMIRRYLDRAGIPYEYVDLDQDSRAEEQLQWITGGRPRTPMVRLGDEWLVQPSVQQLSRALAQRGVR